MIGKWYRLAERYIVVLERIAVAHETNNEIQLRNAASNEKSAAALDARTKQQDTLVVPELGSIVDSLASLASTIAAFKGDWTELLERFAKVAPSELPSDAKDGE